MASPALEAYSRREDLAVFGDNGLLLFALQLATGIDDIESAAATALTDGSNDKKCDLVYVDRDGGRVILAQGYWAVVDTKQSAPANKASDMNTAVTWLLDSDLGGLPEVLQSAAVEVRQALVEGVIREFDIWYVHNLPESGNVARELAQVARTAKGLIDARFPAAQITSITGRELGIAALDELYRRTEVPIIVTDEFEVPALGGFEISGSKWSAYCTSVPGDWLRTLWLEYEANLLSPNVRDYLGIVRSERNINNGIKISAKEEPGRFWVYNNGLTILVNDFFPPDVSNSRSRLHIKGVGIVNGAQTTGCIGTLNEADAARVSEINVMVRFVKCSDPDVLAEIVKYNNTQNKVEAADFRSKDLVQDRLRAEFDKIPDAEYRGGRRGGIRDAIERPKNLLPDGGVAQAIAAFHGRPNLAYNETRKIWEEDGTYAQIFSDKVTARHIVLAYGLLRSIESAKRELSDIEDPKRTALQKQQVSFFRKRGCIPLLVAAIADSLESIFGAAVPNRYALRFKENLTPRQAAEAWAPIVRACLSFSGQLQSACDNDLKNADKVRSAIESFTSMVSATVEANAEKYAAFTALIEQKG
ncbi:AIPR family protein [Actinosynnema sp. NPDC004786]